MAKATLGRAFACAGRGILKTIVRERNMKIHCAAAVLAVALGLALSIDATSWCAVVICIGAVMAAECAKTAMEAVVDLASPEYHELAGLAKDAAAGAVLLLACASVAVACFVYLPRICSLAFG